MKKNIVIIILVILSLGLGIGLFLTYNELSNQKEEIEELEEKIDTYKKDNKNYKDDKEEQKNENKEENNATSSNEDYNLTELTFEEFKTKINNKESFLVLFTQTNCSHCIAYKPTISEVIEENPIIIYELNIEYMNQDEWLELNEYVEVSGTPTLTYIKDGVEKNNLVGNRDKKSIESFLDKEGLA